MRMLDAPNRIRYGYWSNNWSRMAMLVNIHGRRITGINNHNNKKWSPDVDNIVEIDNYFT